MLGPPTRQDTWAADAKEQQPKALLALQKMWGFDCFREGQEKIINDVIAKKDVWVIMPTGGGKTLCYAVPAMLGGGVTVVISPLLALIQDQVSGLLTLKGGGIPAAHISSETPAAELAAIKRDLMRPANGRSPFIKVLFLTPENIVNRHDTRQILAALDEQDLLERFVIDEAHCVSQWGHDFRKDYAKLSMLKENWDVPIVALTATAPTKTVNDVLSILNIQHAERHELGYDRPNLKFEVRDKGTTSASQLLHNVKKFILEEDNGAHRNETGIIYARTQKETEEAAAYLTEQGIPCNFFHAGRSATDKKLVQTAWQEKKIRVVVATIAYGMGIDMATVRYVLHLCLSKSLEGYYQEAGRAGRDRLKARCIVYYHASDVNKVHQLITMNPKPKAVKKREEENLQIMASYCQDVSQCRRKHFRDQFGGSSKSTVFKRCQSMCDNCLGERRQNEPDPNARKPSSSRSSGNNGSSKAGARDKGAGFQKASALPLAGAHEEEAELDFGAAPSSSSSSSARAVFTTGTGRAVNLKRRVGAVHYGSSSSSSALPAMGSGGQVSKKPRTNTILDSMLRAGAGSAQVLRENRPNSKGQGKVCAPARPRSAVEVVDLT